MRIKREISEKGQVVIPKDIREMLGLRKGSNVVFEIRDKEVIIKPEQTPEEFLKDFLDVPKLKKRLTSKEIKKVILEQYDEEIPRR